MGRAVAPIRCRASATLGALIRNSPPPSTLPSRPVLVALALALSLVIGACGGAGSDPSAPPALGSETTGATSTAATPTDSASTSSTSTTSAPAEPIDGGSACGSSERSSDGRVERVDLTEASGLAASRRHEGVLWSHNDSGSAAGLFAFDLAGRDLGFVALVEDGEPVGARDVEDVAITDGTIYLADIGDNRRRRDAVRIYEFDEPEPGADGTVELGRTIEVRYPDGPTDAEALLVDPVDGVLIILSKDTDDVTAPTRIYSVPLPEASEADPDPVEATLAAELDMASIGAGASSLAIGGLLCPGAVTAADLSPSGDLVVLRTYGSAWLFPRPTGATVVDALAGEPCEGGTAGETQGEAIAFLPDGGDGAVRYATVGEGLQQPVHLTTFSPGG